MADLYSEWRDFYTEKVHSWMTLEELRIGCGKLLTVDNPSPEVLLIHAMHALEEYEQRNEALRAEAHALRKPIDRAWNEGFDFAMKACGWQESEDPATEGLYVVRDSRGNVEVGMWYAKTATQPAEWTREFRDVDRDDIVAWMAIPD